jgi:hypothetical protein
MKQVVVGGLALALVATLAGDARAASLTKLGVKGGFTLGRLDDQGAIKDGLDESTGATWEQGTRLGPVAGGFAQIDLSTRFVLRPEVLYVAKGETYSSVLGDVTAQLDVLEVPLLLVARFPAGDVTPALFAGPAVAFTMSAEFANEDIEDLEPFPETKTTDVSLIAGAEATFGGKYSIEGRIWYGLTNLSDSPDVETMKHLSAALLVGVAFDLPRP